jgi:hypothetical protein
MANDWKPPPPGGYGAPPPAYGGVDPHRPDLQAMKRKIDNLQKLYLTLFLTSLAILVASWTIHLPAIGHLAWAVTLGGAVITRISRQSLVTKYNQAIMGGGPAPIQ